jgi:hypothetical protein
MESGDAAIYRNDGVIDLLKGDEMCQDVNAERGDATDKKLAATDEKLAGLVDSNAG